VHGAGGCLEVEEDGPDVVYAVALGTGQRLTVTAVGDHDPSLALHGPGIPSVCDTNSSACVAGVDTALIGELETLSFTATTAGTHDLVVDAFFSELWGSFERTTTIE
jgi:hypothetical protein